MPFGCVAFEATSKGEKIGYLTGVRLQCLSAVWPLRPLALAAGIELPPELSPMPFGCVAFEAQIPSSQRQFNIH